MSGLFTDEVNAFHIAFVPNECVPDDLRAQINRDTNIIVEQAIANVGQQEVAVIAKQTRHSSLELWMIPREFNLISDRLLETAIEDHRFAAWAITVPAIVQPVDRRGRRRNLLSTHQHIADDAAMADALLIVSTSLWRMASNCSANLSREAATPSQSLNECAS